MTITFPKGFTTVTDMSSPEAYEEGQLAYYEDRPATANPYPLPGARAASWHLGWMDAKAEDEADMTPLIVETGGEG